MIGEIVIFRGFVDRQVVQIAKGYVVWRRVGPGIVRGQEIRVFF